MRRENNSVMSSSKNEAVVSHVKAQKTERTPLLTVARFSLWFSGPDSFLESARSDSRFRRNWFVGSRLVPFGHGWSLSFSSGMTNTSTNHYHSSRLIGRVHQPIHTFFSNARWLAEGTHTIVFYKSVSQFNCQ